jgi:predicted RNA-binding Zn-ribbon protein involved in translation (DUF1610 family)
MTAEHNILVGIDEIKSIVLVCTSCKSQIRKKPELREVPFQCPVCGKPWASVQQQSTPNTERRPAKIAFLDAVERVRRVMEDDKTERPDQSVGFHILLEFENPSK